MSLAQALVEILNLILLTIVIGFIISGFIKHPRKSFRQQQGGRGKFFDWDDFKFSILIAAPGIVIHELFHKFFVYLIGHCPPAHSWDSSSPPEISSKSKGFILLDSFSYFSLLTASLGAC